MIRASMADMLPATSAVSLLRDDVSRAIKAQDAIVTELEAIVAMLEGVVATLPSARLHWLDTADHGYKVLKRSRASAEDVFDEIGRVAREFIDVRSETPVR